MRLTILSTVWNSCMCYANLSAKNVPACCRPNDIQAASFEEHLKRLSEPAHHFTLQLQGCTNYTSLLSSNHMIMI